MSRAQGWVIAITAVIVAHELHLIDKVSQLVLTAILLIDWMWPTDPRSRR